MTAGTPRYDALILAGGAGRRLGGADKALLKVGGVTLLSRVIAAVADAERVVCVGPVRVTARPVSWCREEPPGGGPVAAIAAGLLALSVGQLESPLRRPVDVVQSEPDIVVVLAVDLPFVDGATVSALVAAVGDLDGAVAVDESGRLQPLLAAYRRTALDARLSALGSPTGARVHDLVGGLRLCELAVDAAAVDCDTAEALQAARARLSAPVAE